MEENINHSSELTTTAPVVRPMPILEKGKIPPQNIQLEEAVIGGMLVDKTGASQVIDILTKEMFYLPAHQYIYEAIYELFQDTKPIDALTVVEQLRKNGNLEKVGGQSHVVYLTQIISSAAHIEFYANEILGKYTLRSLITMSNEIIEKAYDETTNVNELLNTAEQKIFDISQGNANKSVESAKELIIKAREKILEISKKGEEFSGIPTGFTNIDAITGGWQATDLIIVAARPAMGKTAFTLTMARNIAVERQIPVAFFSLEMGSVQLITRLISAETGIKSDNLRSAKLSPEEWDRLNTKVQDLENAPLYIDDTSALSIFDLSAKARRMVSQYGVKIIFIDYLQLMTANAGKNGLREQEISMISRNLKSLAKDLNIPIIALSQLSRNVESRPGHKRPQLSDLRESGAIEQDADIVTFLYRPSYYGLNTWDDKEETPTANEAELIIAKHRNGGLDNIKLSFVDGVFSNRKSGYFTEEIKSYSSKLNENYENSLPKIEIGQAFDDVIPPNDEGGEIEY